ncbi:MAG TPA: YiiX/YebB-like N1pC/P60 family cysteine hydrolase [Gammaproteobacteria bacterium]|nr:YiiX/YebB-like N1pC/P60 family cysteine hydrolase [Gammaproteobacteria bacterium]
MFKKLYNYTKNKLYHWVIYEPPPTELMPYDFSRLKYEIRPGDVLLIEGRSRVSSVIRTITQSSWTHAALYIGRQVDFEDEEILETVRKYSSAKENTRLILEGLLGEGTIIAPLTAYRHHHMRICRPIGITPEDIQLVIKYTVKALGKPYNIRQLLDLARFLLPWTILPRRWGSSLFCTSSGEPESGICTSIIAEAFSSVRFPIRPFAKADREEGLELFPRNPQLFVPKDFDFSPYFEIIKYPLFNPDDPLPYYQRLPWTKSNLSYQDHGVLSAPKDKIKKNPQASPTDKEFDPSTSPKKDEPPSSSNIEK